MALVFLRPGFLAVPSLGLPVSLMGFLLPVIHTFSVTAFPARVLHTLCCLLSLLFSIKREPPVSDDRTFLLLIHDDIVVREALSDPRIPSVSDHI